MIELRKLADGELLEKTRELVSRERQIATQVLQHLREIEHRRLFVALGYPSLFEYARGDLHYSACAAQRRIDAMRLLKVVPEVEKKIESGTLSLSTVSQAQKFFRQEAKAGKKMAPEEKREVLSALEGKSAREVDRVLISRATEPLSLRPETVRAVSQIHSEVRFLATQDVLDQLERIKGLLGHRHSELSIGEVVAMMAKITLEKLDPTREPRRKPVSKAPETADTQQSRSVPTSEPSKTGRYIPTQVRREVWKRAHGKCQGCGSVYRLQVDHVRPYALGGSNQIENLRLLCFHCNQREADLMFGRGKMERERQTNLLPAIGTASATSARDRPR